MRAWEQIEAEARTTFRGEGRFPLQAYSERMPAPHVGVKPYRPERAARAAAAGVDAEGALEIGEHEQAQLEPGLARLADGILSELARLARGEPHSLSRSLLDGNPAWPAELAAAAHARRLGHDPMILLLPLALSRCQDDKGLARWTLLGASHEGAAGPFWRSLREGDLERVLGFAGLDPARTRILDEGAPGFLHPYALASLEGVSALVSFRPFAALPAAVREAYLAGRLVLAPTPASLVFFAHPGYRRLAAQLPQAMQIPLLHLFPRIEDSCAIRVPQSGWLDENDDGAGHRVVNRVARRHRWQRVARDEAPPAFGDKVSVALFSTDPDAINLYDKPLAVNSQVWSEDYRAILDGPRADAAALARAAAVVEAGGRFGYRFLPLAMRAGAHELIWHRPLVACPGRVMLDGPTGLVSAEAPGAPPLALPVRLLERPAHEQAARLFAHDPGRRRYTTSHNARKLLEARELLGAPLAPSYARALLRVAHETSLGAWLDELPRLASDPAGGERLRAALLECVGAEEDVGPPRTLAATATRAFEETVWRTIAELSEGELRHKDNADAIRVNHGRTGGPAAQAARVVAAEARDLDRLADELKARHRALIARHGMEGRAEVLDHVFRWESEFAFPWMGGWAKNQAGPGERNVVVMIPGRDRGQAVIMGDHYDTAYMEDVYDAERGGDRLRAAAAGADDNHSATTALLMAADALLPLAREGLLARDVWLVHLTGEEYPTDCMGARALAQELVEGRLAFQADGGVRRDVSATRVVAAFVLDMIGHNSEHGRDVFQIAPGEGAASARLALRAHQANRRWNGLAHERNAGRRGLGRAHRMPDGRQPPPPFAHLALAGEVRVEWEPRSALYNTDGQIFSDVGVPVVLFMENYDISRTGYHDTLDTMANIDLDYAAALTAIAVETVADVAMADEV